MATAPRKPAAHSTPLRVSTAYDNGTLCFDPESGKWLWEGVDAHGAPIKASSSTSIGLQDRIHKVRERSRPSSAPAAPQPARETRDVLAMSLSLENAAQPHTSSRSPSVPGTAWVSASPVLVRLEQRVDGVWSPVRFMEARSGATWQSRFVENMLLVAPGHLDAEARTWLAAACARSCMQERYADAIRRIEASIEARPSATAKFSPNRATGAMERLPADAPSGSSVAAVPAGTPLPEVSIKELSADLTGWTQAPSGALEKEGVTIGFKDPRPGYMASAFVVTSSRWGEVAESSSWEEAMVLANRTVAAHATVPVRVWGLEPRSYPTPVEVHASACVQGSPHRASSASVWLLQRDLDDLSMATPEHRAACARRSTTSPVWQHLYRSASEQRWVEVDSGDDRLVAAAQGLHTLLAAHVPSTAEERSTLGKSEVQRALMPSVQAAAQAPVTTPLQPEAVEALRRCWTTELKEAATRAAASKEVAAFAADAAAIEAAWQSTAPAPKPRRPPQA